MVLYTIMVNWKLNGMNKRQFLTYILAGGVGFSTAKVALPVNKESTFTTIAGSKDFLRQVVIGDEELLTRGFFGRLLQRHCFSKRAMAYFF